MQTKNAPTQKKDDIRSLALQHLDGMLDKAGAILYSSYETLRPGEIYLIGLNPGGSESDSTLRGNINAMMTKTTNNYLDQCWGRYDRPGEAPLQKRVQWVLEVLGVPLRDVLATNLVFWQAPNAKEIQPEHARQCWPVHKAMLNIVQPSLIVAYGNGALSPYQHIHACCNGDQEYQRAEHGNWNLKRFQTTMNGRKTTVIGLPHLSYYKPMEKPAVKNWLKESRALS